MNEDRHSASLPGDNPISIQGDDVFQGVGAS